MGNGPPVMTTLMTKERYPFVRAVNGPPHAAPHAGLVGDGPPIHCDIKDAITMTSGRHFFVPATGSPGHAADVGDGPSTMSTAVVAVASRGRQQQLHHHDGLMTLPLLTFTLYGDSRTKP